MYGVMFLVLMVAAILAVTVGSAPSFAQNFITCSANSLYRRLTLLIVDVNDSTYPTLIDGRDDRNLHLQLPRTRGAVCQVRPGAL